jgi:hypothetical protein
MTNLQAIAKECRKQRSANFSRSREWRYIHILKNLDDELSVDLLVKSGIDRKEAEIIIQKESEYDNETFSMEAYRHIKGKRKQAVNLLKGLTEQQN